MDTSIDDELCVVHDLRKRSVLILAESVEKLSSIRLQSSKTLNLIILNFIFLLQFDLDIPFDDVDQRVDKLFRIFIVILVIDGSQD